MAQKAETFFHDFRNLESPPIETLINNYISERPNYKVSSISYIIGGSFEKALVIFDIKEEKECNNERGKQSSQTSTYISKPDRRGSTDFNKSTFGEAKR